MIARLAWAALVVFALGVMLKGLWATFYFEPTGEALAEERTGKLFILVACLLLGGAALWVYRRGAPAWVAVAVLAPVVICGGLTLVPLVIPVLGVGFAYPVALGGLVAGLFVRR